MSRYSKQNLSIQVRKNIRKYRKIIRRTWSKKSRTIN